jgi:hypothetical protein
VTVSFFVFVAGVLFLLVHRVQKSSAAIKKIMKSDEEVKVRRLVCSPAFLACSEDDQHSINFGCQTTTGIDVRER